MGEDRQQLRQALERELRVSPDEMESIWQRLVEDGFVDNYESDETYQFDDLVDDAKETPEFRDIRSKRSDGAGRPLQKLKESFKVSLSPVEQERAAALSEVLARRADEHCMVAEFRKDVLGGVLSPTEARDFITSPAVGSFLRIRFEEWGTPTVGHRAEVICTDRDVEGFKWGPGIFETGFRPWIDRFISLYVEPPGLTKNVLYGSPRVRVPEGLHVDDRLSFTESEYEDEFMRERPESVVYYPWENRVYKVRALPGSLLDELRRLGELLTSVYGWRREDAIWFVLTGEAPYMNPLEVNASLLTGYPQSPPVSTITLEVAPWMPVDSIERTYREIQQQVLKGDSSKGNIKEPRILAVFHFVTEQTRVHGEQLGCQTLFDRWNEKYPEGHEWHYEKSPGHRGDRRLENFRRDFRRAREVVMSPEYEFPERQVNTRIEERQEGELQERRRTAGRELEENLGYLEGAPPEEYGHATD